MISVYEELSGKIEGAASRGARDGARRDLGLVLFAERESLAALWKAAERRLGEGGVSEGDGLAAAVERLRPLFGERA